MKLVNINKKDAMEFAYGMGLKAPEKKRSKIGAALEFAYNMGLRNPLNQILDMFDDIIDAHEDDNMRPRLAI